MDNKEGLLPVNQNNNKADDNSTILETINPGNLKFLMLLLDGKSTTEAYKAAGYDGSDHAAYVMRSRLNKQLAALADSRGLDMAGLKQELLKVKNLPLVRHDKFGNSRPVDGLTPDEFSRFLRLQLDLLKVEKPVTNSITAIQFIRADVNDSPSINKDNVIDANIIKEPDNK